MNMTDLFESVLKESWGIPDDEHDDADKQHKAESTKRRDLMAWVALNTLNCLSFDYDKIDATGDWKRSISMKRLLMREYPDLREDQANEAIAEGMKSLIELINEKITRAEIIEHFKKFRNTTGEPKGITKSWSKAMQAARDDVVIE
jgi:hypothetical protein